MVKLREPTVKVGRYLLKEAHVDQTKLWSEEVNSTVGFSVVVQLPVSALSKLVVWIVHCFVGKDTNTIRRQDNAVAVFALNALLQKREAVLLGYDATGTQKDVAGLTSTALGDRCQGRREITKEGVV